MFDFEKSETLKPDDLRPLEPLETSSYSFTNNMVAKREKAINDCVCGIVRDIATEQGIDTEIIMYEENIVKAIANYTPREPNYDDRIECPRCGRDLGLSEPNYCSHCGQRIDWSNDW